jgi:hypothetical protein
MVGFSANQHRSRGSPRTLAEAAPVATVDLQLLLAFVGAPANDNGMPVYGDQTGGMENQSVIADYGYAAWQKACHQ